MIVAYDLTETNSKGEAGDEILVMEREKER